MSDRVLRDENASTLWGVKHSQGIRWCNSEREARESMLEMKARDPHRQAVARGRVRLVSRDIGPLVFVENPYVDPLSDAGVV